MRRRFEYPDAQGGFLHVEADSFTMTPDGVDFWVYKVVDGLRVEHVVRSVAGVERCDVARDRRQAGID